MKQYINISFSIFLGLILFTSCEDLLEISPEEVLLSKDYLGDNEEDARSALFGVLSQMQGITEQHIVLGEMRADLVDVNANSVDELRQINNHDIKSDNSYLDATTLFSIINNCNFALAGIDTVAYDNRLLDDYASIFRVRVWTQMQILLNYGQLPYVTKPFSNTVDILEDYPLLSFNEGLDQLIEDLRTVSGIENVTKYAGSNGFNITSMIPTHEVLLGDLNLWRGNYIAAAIYYKQFFDDNVSSDSSLYNLSSSTIGVYLSAGVYDAFSFWGLLFDDTIRGSAVINYVGYDIEGRQENTGYSVLTEQMKPSSSILLNWGEQSAGYLGEPVVLSNLVGDNRAPESVSDDLSSITKYQSEYFVWNRVVKTYLRYAEAINYAGYPNHALTIVNGIFNDPDTAANDANIFTNSESFLNFTKAQYYIITNGVPESGNLGVRGRVGMAPVSIAEDLSTADAIDAVGKLILNEAALELAFEGNRWGDLLRFSIRHNDPSIISEAVAQKFVISGDESRADIVRQKLMNPANWFLPLSIPENFVSE